MRSIAELRRIIIVLVFINCRLGDDTDAIKIENIFSLDNFHVVFVSENKPVATDPVSQMPRIDPFSRIVSAVVSFEAAIVVTAVSAQQSAMTATSFRTKSLGGSGGGLKSRGGN